MKKKVIKNNNNIIIDNCKFVIYLFVFTKII